jgi:hypothetical protein
MKYKRNLPFEADFTAEFSFFEKFLLCGKVGFRRDASGFSKRHSQSFDENFDASVAATNAGQLENAFPRFLDGCRRSFAKFLFDG